MLSILNVNLLKLLSKLITVIKIFNLLKLFQKVIKFYMLVVKPQNCTKLYKVNKVKFSSLAFATSSAQSSGNSFLCALSYVF